MPNSLSAVERQAGAHHLVGTRIVAVDDVAQRQGVVAADRLVDRLESGRRQDTTDLVDGDADEGRHVLVRRHEALVVALEMAERPQDLGAALEVAEVQVRVVGIADRPEDFTLDRLVGPVTEATLLGIEAVDRPHQAEHSSRLEVGGVAATRVRRESPAVRAHEAGVEAHDLGGDVFETTPEAGDLTPLTWTSSPTSVAANWSCSALRCRNNSTLRSP